MRIFAYLLIALTLTGCAIPNGESPQPPPPASPVSFRGTDHTQVLIYGGANSWRPEIETLKSILFSHQVTYDEASSEQLNAMSLDEMANYNLLIVPGGNAYAITDSLNAKTRTRLREAVQQQGLSYIGFCAGAWIAVVPAPPVGQDLSYGLGLVDGPIQEHTYLEKQGREFGLSRASFPDGTQRELLWYGGPVTPNVPGGVVAKYADGTPAITQMAAGSGHVIISGLHPAINQLVMSSLGLSSPDAIAPEFAWKLLDAGIHKTNLPAF